MAKWTGQELMAMTDTHPDIRGECDSCQERYVALYEIDLNDQAGGLYCRACLRIVALCKMGQESTVANEESKRM